MEEQFATYINNLMQLGYNIEGVGFYFHNTKWPEALDDKYSKEILLNSFNNIERLYNEMKRFKNLLEDSNDFNN